MATPEELVTQAEQRLAEVEALEQTVQTLRAELSHYHALLGRKLHWLQQAGPAAPDLAADLEAATEPEAAGEVHEEVVAELDLENQPEEAAAERRASIRRKGNPIPVRVTRGDTGELSEGWVVDRSSGGVRILLDQAIPARTSLSIRPVKAVTTFPWIKAEVRSCKPERGGYALGCMFLQKLTWSELQAFG